MSPGRIDDCSIIVDTIDPMLSTVNSLPRYCSKSFLSRCVPDLKFYYFIVHLDRAKALNAQIRILKIVIARRLEPRKSLKEQASLFEFVKLRYHTVG